MRRNGCIQWDYPRSAARSHLAACGRICIGRRKVNLNHVFAGQHVGIKEVAEKIWLVIFMNYDLGFFDEESERVECAPNPFDAKVLCLRNRPKIAGSGGQLTVNILLI